MSKYEVTYSCGHKETMQLYGKEKDRQEKIEWYRTRLCPDCYQAYQAEHIKSKKEEYGLPALTGSPRQIAWAEKIRDKAIEEYEHLVEQEKVKYDYKPDFEVRLKETLETLKPIKDIFTEETEAKFYIDNRDRVGYAQWLTDMLKKWEAKKAVSIPSRADVAPEEMTIMPKTETTHTAVEIKIYGNAIVAIHPEDDDLLKIMQPIYMAYDNDVKAYVFYHTDDMLPIMECAAITAGYLLDGGFPVLCADDGIRAAVKAGR